MKPQYLLYNIIAYTLLFGCAKNSIPIKISNEPITKPIVTIDSTKIFLNETIDNWDKTGTAYLVKKEGFVPEYTNYYLIQLQNDTLYFFGFEEVIDYKNYYNTGIKGHIDYFTIRAKYLKNTWDKIDSMVAPFWQKPEQIPITTLVLDGSATEMQGIKNGKRHKVYCSNADTQDTEFDNVAKVISLHLRLRSLANNSSR